MSPELKKRGMAKEEEEEEEESEQKRRRGKREKVEEHCHFHGQPCQYKITKIQKYKDTKLTEENENEENEKRNRIMFSLIYILLWKYYFHSKM